MEKNKIVLVVEGINDIKKIKTKYKNLLIFKTNGLGITNDLIEKLKNYEKNNYQIILLFDPDHAGKVIREEIASFLKKPYHINLRKDLCFKNGDIGIENINDITLNNLFTNIISFDSVKTNNIKSIDLYNLKLTGHVNSNNLRIKLCEKLNLPVSNNKILLEYLNSINITKKELEKIINEL